MPSKVVVVDNPLNSMEVMRELAPSGFEIVTVHPHGSELNAALQQCAYLVGLGEVRMDDAFYKAAPRLKLVQLLSAGYDRVDIDAARRAGVPVCNNGGANAVAVAEHAMMLMLAVCRRLTWQHDMVVSGRWRGNNIADVRLYELYGRRLGVIGLGTIGKKVARLARAFGLRCNIMNHGTAYGRPGGCTGRPLPATERAAAYLRYRVAARAIDAANAAHDRRG